MLMRTTWPLQMRAKMVFFSLSLFSRSMKVSLLVLTWKASSVHRTPEILLKHSMGTFLVFLGTPHQSNSSMVVYGMSRPFQKHSKTGLWPRAGFRFDVVSTSSSSSPSGFTLRSADSTGKVSWS
uniref:Putative secreted protein n=1 Tax=Ixodes ricinus TaxID=34613 RepID=A0A6B0UNZ3_IXORI